MYLAVEPASITVTVLDCSSSRIRGVMTELSKLEIVERHVIASIQMIALEINPISTHVIVMACEEMILSLADANSILLDQDYRIYVEDEFHKQFRRKVREPYNYFKHADQEPHGNYEGPDEDDLRAVNEIITMMNASGYRSLGGKNISEPIKAFGSAMLLKNPKLFRAHWIEANPLLKKLIAEAEPRRHHTYAALRHLLRASGSIGQT